MLLKKNTYELQSSLAKYCRSGNIIDAGDINPERVTHYRRLVFNVINDSLSSAYPLTKQFMGEHAWSKLTHDFFSNHNCQSFQVWRMPFELYEFVKANQQFQSSDYPFLNELIFFEWLEIEIYMLEDIIVDYKKSGDVLLHKLVLNPEILIQQFHYPVHLKNASEITNEDKSDYFLSIHRHPDTGKVYFTNLSPALTLSLELLHQSPLTLNELSILIAQNIGAKNIKEIAEGILGFLEKALDTKLILGFQE